MTKKLTKSAERAVREARTLAQESNSGIAFVTKRKHAYRARAFDQTINLAWGTCDDELEDGWKIWLKFIA